MIRIVMQIGHIEKVDGGSQSYSMGHQYNVTDELGKRLCGTGVATAVDEGTTLSELYAHETVDAAPDHAVAIDYSEATTTEPVFRIDYIEPTTPKDLTDGEN